MPLDENDYVRPGGERPFSRQGLAEVVRAVLARGACFRFQARGWSMAPCIRDGDLLTLSPITDALHPGDVVSFEHSAGDRLVVHRVIGRNAGGWLVRGDNVPEEDGTVDRMHILGRVTRVERGGRVVRLGLGPERSVVAWLSSHGMLQFALAAIRRLRGRRSRTDSYDE